MQDLDIKQKRELEHPVRFRIWSLYEEDRGRPLTAADLQSHMEDKGEKPSLSQINYHLRRLQLVGLVPEPKPEAE